MDAAGGGGELGGESMRFIIVKMEACSTISPSMACFSNIHLYAFDWSLVF